MNMSFLEPSEMPCDNQNNLGGLADMAQATQMAFLLEGWVNTRRDVPATALDVCVHLDPLVLCTEAGKLIY